jgi:hypothetical protein
MATDTDNTGQATPEAPVKPIRTAYLLLILAGLLGAHRHYLGKWLSGLAYLAVLIAALIADEKLVLLASVAGLVIDAFLLPRMVAEHNQYIAEDFAANPQHYRRDLDATIAPWAREEKTGILDWLKAPGRVFSFIVLPVIYTMLMVQTGNYEFIVFPVIILLATGLVTSLDELAHRHPSVFELPGIENALDRFREIKQYYWDHEPPLRAPLLRVFTRARTEFAPYWKIVGVIVLAILIDLIFSFEDDYGPHLGLNEAWGIILLHVFINAYAVLILLSQLSALSFHYSLSGKRVRLRVLTLIALAMTGLSFAVYMDLRNDPGEVSMLSEQRVSLRLQDGDFLQPLLETSEMVLLFHPTTLGDTEPKRDQICVDFKERNHCKPTQRLRELLKGIAPNDETGAFHVFDAWYDDEIKKTAWRGVRYATKFKRVVVAASNGEVFCRNYVELSPEEHRRYCEEVFKAFINLPGEDVMKIAADEGNTE